VRFVVEPDSGLLGSNHWWYSTPAISPDGQTVVYAAATANRDGRLYARRVGDVTAHPIPGTEGGDAPFFSPDGQWVGFASGRGGTIRKVRLDGGTPVAVAELPPANGSFISATWASNDTIFYCVFASGSALYRVSAAGGTPTRVAVADTTHHLLNPSPLPGGRALLVTSTTDWRVGRVAVLDLATGQVRRFASGTGARYVAGHIVWAGPAGALYRQPFDLDRLAPSGPAEEIANGLDVHYAAFSPFDVSRTGSLVYRVGRGSWKMSVTDRAGREQQVLSERFPWAPRFSPDGRRVVYSALTPGQQGEDMWSGEVWHTDLLVTELASGTTERLTTDGNDNNDPAWRPDGRAIAFDAGLLGTKDIFVRTLDGDSARLLVSRPGNQFPADWTPDGNAVFFDDPVPGIWLQPVSGGAPRTYAAGADDPGRARVSPDGHWIAYSSNEMGRREVYVQSYPTPGRKVLVSAGGGTAPAWRRDGRELYYWQGDQLIAASLEARGAGDPPIVRGRTPLFHASLVGGNYDVSPDGTRFVVVVGGPRESHLVVALDALGDLRR
jgi:serine/threonine-protein kinase